MATLPHEIWQHISSFLQLKSNCALLTKIHKYKDFQSQITVNWKNNSINCHVGFDCNVSNSSNHDQEIFDNDNSTLYLNKSKLQTIVKNDC